MHQVKSSTAQRSRRLHLPVEGIERGGEDYQRGRQLAPRRVARRPAQGAEEGGGQQGAVQREVGLVPAPKRGELRQPT